MITPHNISSISDLRFKTKEVLKKAQKEPIYLFYRNIPKGVLLSYKSYLKLMSDLEDYHDSIKAKEYEKQDKSKIKWVSSSQVEKMLNE